MAVQSVQGAEVADWSIEADPAVGPHPAIQRLVVSLKTELTTGTDVDIRAYRRDRQATGTIDIHALEPLGVIRKPGAWQSVVPTPFRVHISETAWTRSTAWDWISRVGWDFVPTRRPGRDRVPTYEGRPGLIVSVPVHITAVASATAGQARAAAGERVRSHFRGRDGTKRFCGAC